MNGKTILVIENSATLLYQISETVETVFHAKVLACKTYQEVVSLLDDSGEKIHGAISSTILPDAQDAQILDLLSLKKIPTAVLTSRKHDKAQQKLRSGEIVCVVEKENSESIHKACSGLKSTLERLYGS